MESIMKRVTNSDLEFLTPKEVAAMLRLSVRTLEGKRRDGTGPAFTTLGNDRNSKVVYRLADIYRWLADKSRSQVIPFPGHRARKPVGAPTTHLALPADPPPEGDGDDDWVTIWLVQTEV
jgi:hypothetical protein